MSEPSGTFVSLDVIREALRRAIDATSLRQVARDADLSPRGLTLVVKGSKPRKSTVWKVRGWYARHAAANGGTGVSDEMAAASLSTLLHGLDGPDREYAATAILGVLESFHRRREVVPPGWIDGVRKRQV